MDTYFLAFALGAIFGALAVLGVWIHGIDTGKDYADYVERRLSGML